jgi:hypothetical protein
MTNMNNKSEPKYNCPICRDPANEVMVYLPTCCYVRFCKACLLALPGAITEALADYLDTSTLG